MCSQTFMGVVSTKFRAAVASGGSRGGIQSGQCIKGTSIVSKIFDFTFLKKVFNNTELTMLSIRCLFMC